MAVGLVLRVPLTPTTSRPIIWACSFLIAVFFRRLLIQTAKKAAEKTVVEVKTTKIAQKVEIRIQLSGTIFRSTSGLKMRR